MPIIYLQDSCSCQQLPCTCTPAPSCLPQPHIDDCNSCAPITTCATDTGCPIQLDSSCIFYHKFGLTATGLTNLALPNGSNLSFILDTLDDYLATLAAYTFPPFVTTCIGIANTTIITISDFMQAVDDQFCSVKSDLNSVNNLVINDITNITTSVDTINHPNITSSCVGLAILATDTIQQILVKLKDAYCSLYSSIISDQSPDFAPIDSNSISWFLAGIKGHMPTANVKKSVQPGNVLQILPDGLFVGDLPALSQTISYNSGTNSICLSGGGGCAALPAAPAPQTLSLNTSTNILSISGGNTVDFTPILPAFIQTPINPTSTNSIQLTASGTANTNITADVNISGDAGNAVSIHSDGIFVQTPPTPIVYTDELVKASSAGIAGTLINKVEGCVNGPMTTAVTYNNISDRLNVCTTLDATSLLTEIAGTPALLTALCNMVKGCVCFKFRFINTDVSSSTYGYTACDGTVHSGLSLGAGGVVEVCGTAATTGANTVYVFNLGFC